MNLNTATPALLRALLLGVGANHVQATALARAIVDWRETGNGPAVAAAKRRRLLAAGLATTPPEAPFRSVEELGLVLGIIPDLLAKLEPHLTVWSSYGPVPTSTDPVVRNAMERVETRRRRFAGRRELRKVTGTRHHRRERRRRAARSPGCLAL